MGYNILVVLSLMSWEKVLLESVWKRAQIHSSCFFLDCSIICLKLFTCLLMVIPACPRAVSSPNIVLLDWKNLRSSSLLGMCLAISTKSLLKHHGPICHKMTGLAKAVPLDIWVTSVSAKPEKLCWNLKWFSNCFRPPLWTHHKEAVT